MTEQHPVGGYVAFSCDDNEYLTSGDPDAAERALRCAGFNVMRLPERFRSQLAYPGDDHMLVTRRLEQVSGEVCCRLMDEINAIVDPYGGLLCECGWMDPSEPPFEELFADPQLHRRRNN
jgi:hypothetical protein